LYSELKDDNPVLDPNKQGRKLMQEIHTQSRRPRFLALSAFMIIALSFGTPDTGRGETSTFSAKLAGNEGISSYAAQPGVTGSFAIAGSDTMQPLMAKLLAAFKEWQPTVKTVVQGGGSDAALRGFIEDQATIRRGDAKNIGHHVSGRVGLLASSRTLTRQERGDFQARYGFEPTEIPIAMDGVAIYVHRDNPLQGLTIDQVDAIFGKDRKRGFRQAITKWGDLGLEHSWEAQPINLYGRDKRSGTRTFFIHEALLDGKMNPDVKEAPGSASEILEISRDPLAMGYAGSGFQASTVRMVPIASKAGMGFVTATAETAMNGSYPLARHLYLYAKKDPERDLDPQILAFLKFINSREGQQTVARAGFYPLSETQVTKNLQILDGSYLSAINKDESK
jgi:phosphate transport system substrate-binding protein